MDRTQLKEQLLVENGHFRSLSEKHQACEKELHSLKKQAYISVDDERYELELKKRKLQLKDQMESILDQASVQQH